MTKRTAPNSFAFAHGATATDEPPAPAACGPDVEDDGYFDGIPADMAEFRAQVVRVAPQDTTILLTGETGTGKTRLARLIHGLSRRRDGAFQVVDCGALSPSLIESEMFGHVRGAFTGADRDRAGKFASAGQGTLLLDEINSLPLHLQGKLLRAVEDRVFEPVGANRPVPLQARIIAVTNSRLEDEIEAGRFRSDLYFRLNVVGFYLPPLRSRRSSVAQLCEKFLAEFSARNRPDVTALDPDALAALQDYHWPGNIRELRNVIERAVALCAGPVVEMGDLPEAIRRGAGCSTSRVEPSRPDEARVPVPAGLPGGDYNGLTLAESKEIAEIRQIKAALAKHNNNRLRAASELGISRMGLYKKLHKYGLVDRGGLGRANELAS
jgi:transcriptional regulator with PAS, ATPase and Fis domain